MKKLLSLFVLALLSTQMWAVSPNASKTVTRNGTDAGTYIVYTLANDGHATPIDMGSGIAWADRNVGMTSAPTTTTTSSGSGYLFCWGETSNKTTNATNKNYTVPTSGYNPTLPSNNDAATAIWGSNWRTPTKGEWDNLRDALASHSTSTAVSKNGNKIILLNTGDISSTSSTTRQNTSYGWYWTSTYKQGTTNTTMQAYVAKISPSAGLMSTFIATGTAYYGRNGYAVRAVYDPSFDVYTLTIKAGNKDYIYKCESGQKITITPNAGTGYRFTGWTKTSGTTLNLSGNQFTVTGDATYTANFVEDVTQYTVTINTPSNGTLQVKNGNNILSSGAQVDENTTLTIVTTNSTAHYHCSSVSVLNGSTPVSVSNNQFTLTSDVTVSATFVEDAKYTVNITTPENGTISVMNGNTPVNNGDKVYTGTVLTITATGDTENHYEFKSWKEGTPALTNNQFTLNSDVTIGANFGLEVYTIRFLMDDGVTELSTAQVAYNDNPIQPVEPSKIETEEYSYNFVGWDADNDGIADDVTPVTGDQDYVAVFEQVALTPKYTITIGALTNGSVTITTDGGTEFVPAAGGSYKYEEGTMVILKAKAERGYHFTEWNDGTETASRRIELTENTTLTPTFAANTLFELRDAWEEDDCTNNYDMDNVLTVTLTDRTFKQNEWATISLPFNCTLEQGDDMYGYIYKFGKVTLAADGGSINVEFNRTYEITANEPYLVVTQENITAPKFYGVSLVSPESVILSSDGQVSFVSNLWKMTINGLRDFYVGNRSALRYAKTTGTVINANRAFFRKSEGAPAPRRLKVMIDGVETTMQITEEGDIEQAEETRKYVEDGILIIERNGVRYNATGAVAQ